MKTSSHSLLKPALLTASALVISLFALEAQQRIVIEGGPGKIRISGPDRRPEAVNLPEINPQGATTRPSRGIIMRTPGTATVAPADPLRTRTDIDAGTGEETPEIERQEPTIELTKVMQLARYEEELGIAESAAESQIIFEANALFDAGVTTISVAAELSLDTLAKYMELSNQDEVSVSYRFVPGKETPRLARERSQSLISYFTDEAAAVSTTFEVLTPEALEESVTEAGKTPEGFESLVVISLR